MSGLRRHDNYGAGYQAGDVDLGLPIDDDAAATVTDSDATIAYPPLLQIDGGGAGAARSRVLPTEYDSDDDMTVAAEPTAASNTELNNAVAGAIDYISRSIEDGSWFRQLKAAFGPNVRQLEAAIKEYASKQSAQVVTTIAALLQHIGKPERIDVKIDDVGVKFGVMAIVDTVSTKLKAASDIAAAENGQLRAALAGARQQVGQLQAQLQAVQRGAQGQGGVQARVAADAMQKAEARIRELEADVKSVREQGQKYYNLLQQANGRADALDDQILQMKRGPQDLVSSDDAKAMRDARDAIARDALATKTIHTLEDTTKNLRDYVTQFKDTMETMIKDVGDRKDLAVVVNTSGDVPLSKRLALIREDGVIVSKTGLRVLFGQLQDAQALAAQATSTAKVPEVPYVSPDVLMPDGAPGTALTIVGSGAALPAIVSVGTAALKARLSRWGAQLTIDAKAAAATAAAQADAVHQQAMAALDSKVATADTKAQEDERKRLAADREAALQASRLKVANNLLNDREKTIEVLSQDLNNLYTLLNVSDDIKQQFKDAENDAKKMAAAAVATAEAAKRKADVDAKVRQQLEEDKNARQKQLDELQEERRLTKLKVGAALEALDVISSDKGRPPSAAAIQQVMANLAAAAAKEQDVDAIRDLQKVKLAADKQLIIAQQHQREDDKLSTQIALFDKTKVDLDATQQVKDVLQKAYEFTLAQYEFLFDYFQAYHALSTRTIEKLKTAIATGVSADVFGPPPDDSSPSGFIQRALYDLRRSRVSGGTTTVDFVDPDAERFDKMSKHFANFLEARAVAAAEISTHVTNSRKLIEDAKTTTIALVDQNENKRRDAAARPDSKEAMGLLTDESKKVFSRALVRLKVAEPKLQYTKDNISVAPMGKGASDEADIKWLVQYRSEAKLGGAADAKAGVSGRAWKTRRLETISTASSDSDEDGEEDEEYYRLTPTFTARPLSQYQAASITCAWLEHGEWDLEALLARCIETKSSPRVSFGRMLTDVSEAFVLQTRALPTVALVCALQSGGDDKVLKAVGYDAPGRLKTAGHLLRYLARSQFHCTVLAAQLFASSCYPDVEMGLVCLDHVLPVRMLRMTEALIQCSVAAHEALLFIKNFELRAKADNPEPQYLLQACLHLATVAVTLNQHILVEVDDFQYIPALCEEWRRVFSLWASTAVSSKSPEWQQALASIDFGQATVSMPFNGTENAQFILSTLAMHALIRVVRKEQGGAVE